MSEDTTSGDDPDDDGIDVTVTDEEGTEIDDSGSGVGVPGAPEDVEEGLAKGRERLQEEADRAVEGFDEGVVDVLSWALDTETRARIYVYLRGEPGSTSEEVAEGTGLYPSTVREALAEMTDEGTVTREKRESEGAGNNPYEYEAIAPSDLVGGVVADVQQELNAVFNLDQYLGVGGSEPEPDVEPVNITVEDEAVGGTDLGEESDGGTTEDEQPADEGTDADANDGEADDGTTEDEQPAEEGTDADANDGEADDADDE